MKNKCVAIISGAPLNLAPYLNFYISILKKNNIKYILLNVENENYGESDIVENQIIFRYRKKPGLIFEFYRKMRGIIFVINNIIKYHCIKVVVAPTRTGITLSPLLFCLFNRRFILDIRDFTNENNKKFKRREDKLISHSYLTLVSSRGFLEWVKNSDNVKVVHNIPFEYTTVAHAKTINQSSVCIGSVGMIGHWKENKELISKLREHQVYKLFYYGILVDDWYKGGYVESLKDVANITFFGAFKNSEKGNIYQNIDMINGIFGVDTINSRTLLANRLYDCAIYKKPIIVSSGTYLSKVVEKYGIGLSLDVFKDDVADMLNTYLKMYDRYKFAENCITFLKDVTKEQDDLVKELIKFLL